jgi:hypothetical protein
LTVPGLSFATAVLTLLWNLTSVSPGVTLDTSAKGASSPRERAEPTEQSGITISIFFQPVVRTRAN